MNAEQNTVPGSRRQGPGEPAQPGGPEVESEAQAKADEIVNGAGDHAAASAGTATRRAAPPCVRASASASAKRASPSQCCKTRLKRKPAARNAAAASRPRGAGKVIVMPSWPSVVVLAS